MKINRILSLISAVVALAMIVVGLTFLFSHEDAYTTSTDYASFGADFYTYAYKGIRAAASNAGNTAHKVANLSNIVSAAAGWVFIFAGTLIILSNIKQMISSGDLQKTLDALKNMVPAKKAPTAEQTAELLNDTTELLAEMSDVQASAAEVSDVGCADNSADQNADPQA